jgi:hypothetical protein
MPATKKQKVDKTAYIPVPARKNAFASPEAWWLVDLQSDCAQGTTPLVQRCMKHYSWSEVQALAYYEPIVSFCTAK